MGDGDEISALTTLALLSEARAGNELAVNVLFERHRRLLERWGRGRLPPLAHDLVDTEDLVQEVLSRTLHHLGSFDPQHSGAFRAYLRRGFLRLVLDHGRRVRRKPPPLAGPAEDVWDHRPSPQDEALERDRLERYERALEKLSSRDRAAIIARVELGLKYGEIARELGMPSADAARKSVAEAVKRLGKQMETDENEGGRLSLRPFERP
jgi:RNA polymerase sigma-70 factor (ECF subfamily)